MGLVDNIVFYAKLDEVSGNPIDSVNSVIGDVTGVTQNATGKINKAVTFSSGIIDFGNPAQLNLVSAGTMSAWIYPTGFNGGNYAAIMVKMDWNLDRNGYSMFLSPGGALEFSLSSASAWCPLEAGSVNLNEWTHIVCTWNGTTMKLYINGIFITSTAQTLTPVSNVHNFQLGKNTAYTPALFIGSIDEVGLWSREITSTEVSTLYNSGDGMSYPFNIFNIVLRNPKISSNFDIKLSEVTPVTRRIFIIS